MVNCPGTYNYENTTYAYYGVINVTTATGISSVIDNYSSLAYPNPFSANLSIEAPDADMITLYNVVGAKIRTIVLQHGQTKTVLNTSDFQEGVYFYAVLKEETVIETKKIIKN